MKLFNMKLIALSLMAGCLVLASIQVEASRASRRQQAAASALDQDETGLEEAQAQPTRRRSQSSRRSYSDEEADETGPGSTHPTGSSDDSGSSSSDDYQPAARGSRAGGRKRYQDQDDQEARPARRRTRKNRRGNSNGGNSNNNNVNFNSLPDGFPSAAFGAGFGAAVSSGGRGRGPSNAAGFGAGFAQSGGGNALAGGFGSGLVNGGYGGSGRNNNYDDDEDTDYDSGRDKSKLPPVNCMMLQLVQSPSQRIQRLIKRNCSPNATRGGTSEEKLETGGKRPMIGVLGARSKDGEKIAGAVGTTSRRAIDTDNQQEDDDGERVAIDEQKASESRIQRVSSMSRSLDSEGEPSVTRVNRLIDSDGNLIVASSSSYTSNSSIDDNDDDNFDSEESQEGDNSDGNN